MRLIYTKDGFTKAEKDEWRVIIFNNILDGLRLTIDAMDDLNIEFEHENTSVSKCYDPSNPSGNYILRRRTGC